MSDIIRFHDKLKLKRTKTFNYIQKTIYDMNTDKLIKALEKETRLKNAINSR